MTKEKLFNSINTFIKDNSRTCFGIFNACGYDTAITSVEDPEKISGIMHNFKTTLGFTLIELLVVVLIIGILAAIALPQYQLAVEKARAMQIFVLGKYLKNQEELYYLTHGTYTNNFNELGAELPREFTLNSAGTHLFPPHTSGYITLLENYNRIDYVNLVPRYGISFPLDIGTHLQTETRNKTHCTAYALDNYRAASLCKNLTKDHSEGYSGCNETCKSWFFK